CHRHAVAGAAAGGRLAPAGRVDTSVPHAAGHGRRPDLARGPWQAAVPTPPLTCDSRKSTHLGLSACHSPEEAQALQRWVSSRIDLDRVLTVTGRKPSWPCRTQRSKSP